MKENQNDNNNLYENRINRKSIYSCKTILLIFITFIIGLSFIAAIIFVSFEFYQIQRLAYEASGENLDILITLFVLNSSFVAFALQTSNSMNSTILTAIQRTSQTTSIMTTVSPSTTTLSTTTSIAVEDLAITIN